VPAALRRDGDLHLRIPQTGRRDELDVLAATVNRMLDGRLKYAVCATLITTQRHAAATYDVGMTCVKCEACAYFLMWY